MATRKENLKSLFSNTRARLIIILTVLVLIATIVIGFVKFHSAINASGEKSDVMRGASGIRSIPGSLNQTAQYAALQETQNVEQAKDAQAKGKSAIPTIISSQAFGEGIESVGAQNGEGGLGFSSLARQNLEGAQSSLWYQNLKEQHCSQDSLTKALDAGASLQEVKQVCTCEQLKHKGYTLSELKGICPCPELRKLGFSAKQFKDAGYCAAEMKICGFTACEERGAGFSADEMKNAGYSDGEMAGSGFSAADIARAGGLPDGVTLSDVQKAGCSKENLRRLRSQGVSAAIIKRVTGCSAEALKSAGYTALELKNAGFSAAELKAAGFSAAQLNQAGFSPRALLDAGFTPSELSAAGFSPADISAAETLLPNGISAEDVRKAGCSEEALKRQRLAGVSAYMIKKIAGCSANALNAAGFSVSDLARAGFKSSELTPQALGAGAKFLGTVTDQDIRKAGCDVASLQQLRAKGVSARRIRETSGCSVATLKNAGFGPSALLDAGFTGKDLIAAGFSPTDIALAAGLPDGVSLSDVQKAGCSAANLANLRSKGVSAASIRKITGCSVQELKAAGYSATELKNAGFTADALKAAGFSAADLKTAGFTASELKAAGFTAGDLKAAGFSPSALLDGGFTGSDLLAAGFSAESVRQAALAAGDKQDNNGVSNSQLLDAGCDPNQLKRMHDKGVSAKRIHDLSGCSALALRNAGYSVSELANAGYEPGQLLADGFTPAELKSIGLALMPAGVIAAGRSNGCSPEKLRDALRMGISAAAIKQQLGCSAKAMKEAGFSALDLKEAGFSAAELKNSGYALADLKAAGFSAKDLRTAGFSAAELKAAGFSSSDLKDAGFSAAELKNAGFSALDLKTAGFTAADLKKAGFLAAEMKAAGFTAADMKTAGMSAAELKAAGYSQEDIQAAGFPARSSALAGLENLDTNQVVPDQVFPSIPGAKPNSNKTAKLQADNAKNLEKILARQKVQMADQKYQQKVQQRTTLMNAAANQLLQAWKVNPQQSYVAGAPPKDAKSAGAEGTQSIPSTGAVGPDDASTNHLIVKMGDVMFAVIDTSVNSDEPSPILATIVSGALKGAKLIGSFNLPSNSEKMVISFNSMSVPGASKTIGITAFAIDPNTARTAIASETDHHYLSRYGALFASTFLEGFGNAFQSADTTITVGGAGTTQNTTVQNGIGRSTLQNAVIGLAEVGKAWGQVAQQNVSRPITVEVYSGTGVGVLFTQDIQIARTT